MDAVRTKAREMKDEAHRGDAASIQVKAILNELQKDQIAAFLAEDEVQTFFTSRSIDPPTDMCDLDMAMDDMEASD